MGLYNLLLVQHVTERQTDNIVQDALIIRVTQGPTTVALVAGSYVSA
jgi:hypothetical protein